MKYFKNIKTVVFFLLMAFMCAGIGYSQSLLEIVKTVKETKESFKKVKSERNNITQKSLNNGESRKSESESLEHQNIVTLIVSADGSTKDEATKIALRSAIEQAFGTFVSANTTILNDELVKDEIITVTNGNIKSYEEISTNIVQNGKTYVTLKATVCISKLVNYAQNKGVETEFAGATFAMNMKMKELNKQNELKALKNLTVQVKEMLPYSFNAEITIKPMAISRNLLFGMFVNGKDEITSDFFYDEPKDIAKWATNTHDKSEQFINNPKEDLVKDWFENAGNNYLMDTEIVFKPNENTKSLFDLISGTLSNLSVERDFYVSSKEQTDHEVYISYGNYYNQDKVCPRYWLRNSRKDLATWINQLRDIFEEYFINFKIMDNLGKESFLGCEIYKKPSFKTSVHTKDPVINDVFFYQGDHWALTNGYGLFSPVVLLRRNWIGGASSGESGRIDLIFPKDYDRRYDGPEYIKWKIRFLIPKSEIGKYTKFTVENRK